MYKEFICTELIYLMYKQLSWSGILRTSLSSSTTDYTVASAFSISLLSKESV